MMMIMNDNPENQYPQPYEMLIGGDVIKLREVPRD
jgi:hypothetical protein